MVEQMLFGSREEWLKAREKRIGGSECAAILGVNPYISNVDLWKIKTGRMEREDVSGSPSVRYGAEAEQYLRKLFELDFPDFSFEYMENNMWINSGFPFAHASLDGWMLDIDGRFGILEIKTGNIISNAQREKWNKQIPSQYFCQVLWYMAVTEAEFAIVKAQLKHKKQEENEPYISTRHYLIEREKVQEDIEFLMEKAEEFYGYIERDEEPPLILPMI